MGPLKIRVLLDSQVRSMTAARRRFSQEFKEELCLEVISTSKTIKKVAVSCAVGEMLRNWLRYEVIPPLVFEAADYTAQRSAS